MYRSVRDIREGSSNRETPGHLNTAGLCFTHVFLLRSGKDRKKKVKRKNNVERSLSCKASLPWIIQAFIVIHEQRKAFVVQGWSFSSKATAPQNIGSATQYNKNQEHAGPAETRLIYCLAERPCQWRKPVTAALRWFASAHIFTSVPFKIWAAKQGTFSPLLHFKQKGLCVRVFMCFGGKGAMKQRCSTPHRTHTHTHTHTHRSYRQTLVRFRTRIMAALPPGSEAYRTCRSGNLLRTQTELWACHVIINCNWPEPAGGSVQGNKAQKLSAIAGQTLTHQYHRGT